MRSWIPPSPASVGPRLRAEILFKLPRGYSFDQLQSDVYRQLVNVAAYGAEFNREYDGVSGVVMPAPNTPILVEVYGEGIEAEPFDAAGYDLGFVSGMTLESNFIALWNQPSMPGLAYVNGG